MLADLNKWLKKLLDGPGLKKSRAPLTVQEQHAALVARMAEDNKHQGNPFNVPEGWHKVVTASGGESFGFYCNTCKLQMLNAGATVKHCRRVETRPSGRLALLRLKSFTPGPGQVANRWKMFS
jgi:hypothetical protein